MNLLLVDDHALFRRGVMLALSEADPRIEITESGTVDGALDHIRRGNPVDLMILDLLTPGYTGLQALEKVRALCPQVPVLVLSAEEDPAIVRRAIDLGACGYLTKTAPADALQNALRLVLSGGVFLPASSLTGVAAGQQRSSQERWDKLGARLTRRQKDVLLGIVQGKPNKLIARELGVSEGTIKTHLAHIFNALMVSSRTQAVYALAQAGLSVRDLRSAVEDAEFG